VRHDPPQRLDGVALFALAGAPDPADPSWPPGTTAELEDELVADAGRRFGYRLLPSP
jgi:hypothetical protein